MPLIKESKYKPPFYYRNGHVSTIAPSLFNKVTGPRYTRERLEIADGDFLDIDWLRKESSDRVVIISHGLEGSSSRHYITNAARYFNKSGWSVMAWNYRSCSGEMNRLLRLYHHGVTDDLEAIVNHAISLGYDSVYLLGYSMGGSTTLKYLGEQGENISPAIKAATGFSVPCNLWNSAEMLLKKSNRIYKNRFLKKLKRKIVDKSRQFPHELDVTGISDLSTFHELDTRYTAPLHGFDSAKHFYETSTCDIVIPKIRVRTLIVNAKNDPLLGEKCYPHELAKNHDFVYLETPDYGGHVGFPLANGEHSWSEVRALQFFENHG